MEKVLVLGSINIDFVSFVSQYPKPGETLIGNDFGIFQGGKGANQAIALAKLDVPTLMLGKVGKDALNDFALSSLRDSGVDVNSISISQEKPTGSASIWVNTEGQNSIIIYPGANGEVDEDFIIINEKYFSDVSYLLVQFEVPIKSVVLALKIAKKNGVKTIVDPAPVPSDVIIDDSIWQLINYLVPNEIELRSLTGTDKLLDGISLIKSKGTKEVIVKLGSQGAGYADRGELILLPSEKIERIIDTTGAGDCFVAGFIYGLLEKKDIPHSIKIGNLAASYSIQKRGAAISFPNKSEIDWGKLE